MGCPSTCTGYELLNDIDLSGGNWDPIGGGSRTFNFARLPDENHYNRVFEGNGHVISNMRIDGGNSDWDFTGLFRGLGAASVVRNVGLVNVNVRSAGNLNFYTGALAGTVRGRIASSYVAGGTIAGGFYTGSLVGGLRERGIIIASYTNVSMPRATLLPLGGLVGHTGANSIVSASYTLVESQNPSDFGGLVGLHAPAAEIQSSYFDRGRAGVRSCCSMNPPSPDRSATSSVALRTPTSAAGIYAGWDKLDLDGDNVNDDAPWDFGNPFQYPVLRGNGNTTNIGVQQRLQPPVFATFSRRGGALVAEGSTVTYAVALGGVADVATVRWSVVPTGVGSGHAVAADFSTTRGTLTLVNTDSAVFQVGIARDQTPEGRERFRVRLSDFQWPDNSSLSVARSTVDGIIVQSGTDFDRDDNKLIEVATTSQLAAIGYDLGGAGRLGVSAGNLDAYDEAFPSFDEGGCPGGCKGYELVNDLDLSGEDWMPLGGGARDLSGDVPPAEIRYNATFEGNGHVIRNMRVGDGNAVWDFAGLFRALGADGIIRNVGLVDVDVRVSSTNSVQTGALAGVSYGRIAASYATSGSVVGGRGVGGLVGRLNAGTVVASYADVSVNAGNRPLGGLTGGMDGTSVVSASYSIGRVQRSGAEYGGLTGARGSDAEIQSSYFDLDRSGQTACCGTNAPSPDEAPRLFFELRTPTSAVGIYAGWDRLNVDGVGQDADGDVNDDAPWDFGSAFEYPVLRGVSARYSTGNTASAGVQRRLQPPVSVAALSQRSGDLITEGSSATYAVELGVRSTAEVTVSWAVEIVGVGRGYAEEADFDGTTRGTLTLVDTSSMVFRIAIEDDEVAEDQETFRVRLRNLQGVDGLRLSAAGSAVESVIAVSDPPDYDPDDDGLISVMTTAQLAAVRFDLDGDGVPDQQAHAASWRAAFPLFDAARSCPVDGCGGYELSNDIFLGLSSFPSWTPIAGGNPMSTDPTEYYSAVFEGNGFVISSMTIARGSALFHRAGLFGAVSSVGTIRNVGLRDVNVNVGNESIETSALVGRNAGKVAASYVARGRVEGAWSVGGLAGVNSGTVIASYANVAVHARRHRAGGLIGEAAVDSVVSASYSTGEVTGGAYNNTTYSGGLTGGRNEADANAYDVQASYYDRERSGQTSCCGEHAPSVDAGTSRTSLQLRVPLAAQGIYAGWDRLNVDDVPSTVAGVVTLNDDAPWDFGSGFDYPMLRGVSTRFPSGNPAAISVQRGLQPPVLMTLSQRGDALVAEGQMVEYTMKVDGYSGADFFMRWNVELTGPGASHAERSDFDGTRAGVLNLANTSSAIFRVEIVQDGTPESRESFRVRFSRVLIPDILLGRLNDASSALVTTIVSHGVDYDRNNNNLIDVATTSQLAAIRYDLGGKGLRVVDGEDGISYNEAFPSFDERGTCAGGCKGYELMNDLDLSGLVWQPIGGGGRRAIIAPGNNRLPEEHRYKAVFDGNGHVVSNMEFLTNDTWHFVGLFRALDAGGIIRNVGLTNVNLGVGRSSIQTGALAGANYGGKVAACYVAGGDVMGGWGVGGLVGHHESGTIIASYADVDVKLRAISAGGLVAVNGSGGKIIASYSLGNVGVPNFGIVFAFLNKEIGALVGNNAAASTAIESSYFDTDRSGLSFGGSNVSATAVKTSRELRSPVAAEGIYAAWSGLNVDDTSSTVMGVLTLNDDNPWDFGSPFDYPVLGHARSTATVQAQFSRQEAVTLTATFRGDPTVSEGATANYVVSLDQALPLGVTASWGWSVSGTGIDVTDFANVPMGRMPIMGRVAIAPGESSAALSLAVRADGALEFAETYEVSLGDARLEGASERARLVGPSSGVRTTIAVNERGQVTLAAASATVAEGATATFTLRLNGGRSTDVVVEFQIVPVSAELTPADIQRLDYVNPAGGAESKPVSSFSDGTSTGTVVLNRVDNVATVSVGVAVDDVAGEGEERFRLWLRNCRDCDSALVEIGVPSSAQVTISRTPLTVSARTYLQGAYAGSGRMSTNLISILPRRQPYGTAPWHYPITTTVPHVAEVGLGGASRAIVDWVLVELRASTAGAGAGAAVPVTDGFAAGLLLADGRIAGINEAAPAAGAALSSRGVSMAAAFPQGAEVYVLVHHRNHLSVMSASPAVTRSAACETDYCVDFRERPAYVGCAQLRHADGNWLMAAGDVNRSGVVSWGDDDFILNNLQLSVEPRAAYMPREANYLVDGDLNFDGEITSDDYRLILDNNLLSSRECASRR